MQRWGLPCPVWACHCTEYLSSLNLISWSLWELGIMHWVLLNSEKSSSMATSLYLCAGVKIWPSCVSPAWSGISWSKSLIGSMYLFPCISVLQLAREDVSDHCWLAGRGFLLYFTWQGFRYESLRLSPQWWPVSLCRMWWAQSNALERSQCWCASEVCD